MARRAENVEVLKEKSTRKSSKTQPPKKTAKKSTSVSGELTSTAEIHTNGNGPVHQNPRVALQEFFGFKILKANRKKSSKASWRVKTPLLLCLQEAGNRCAISCLL